MVIEEHAYLEILLPNEEKWRNIGENDIIQNSLSITQKCMDDSTFMLGGVYSAQMSAKVRIIGENVNSYTVTGAKILVYSWYGDDRNSRRLRGVFWATSVTKNGDIFTISASDPLIWLDSASYGEEGGSANPLYHLLEATLGSLTSRLKIIIDFVNQMLDEDKKIDYYYTSYIINHYPGNVGYCLLPSDIVGEISTKNPRDYVSWLAEIACGFVFVDNSDDVPKIRIGQFGEDIGVGMGNEISWDEVELNSCEIADFSLKFDYCVATVYTGKTEYSSVHNSGGIVIDLSDNPFKDGFWHYNWQDCHGILENIIQKLNNEKVIFRPFSLKCHCAKYFELGQKIRLPDGRNSTLTSIKWLFRGGYTLGCT
ncbi:MAG: hypothetical protein K2J08_10630, partial [Ruminococcus sp.]|nr:hypothetical protein [Ruminococcus sp.]